MKDSNPMKRLLESLLSFFKTKDPRKLWNKLHPWYIKAMWYTVAHIVTRGHAKDWIKKGDGRFLCLGSGSGIETHELERDEGIRVDLTAVDVSDEGLAAHKELNPNPANEYFCMKSLEYLRSQEDNSWENVYALNSSIFENMDDLREYFREIHRVLKPGGRFWISIVHKYKGIDIMKIQANVGNGSFSGMKARLHMLSKCWRYRHLVMFVFSALFRSNLKDKIYLSHEQWEEEMRNAGLQIQESFPTAGYDKYEGPAIGGVISGIVAD